MASNFHQSLGQTSSLLSYSMRNMNLGPVQPTSLDVTANPVNPGYSFDSCRPLNNGSTDPCGSSFRITPRSTIPPDFPSVSNNSGLRPHLLQNSGMNAGIFGGGQNGIFGLNERPVSVKSNEVDDLSSYRLKANAPSTSRILSSLQATHSLPIDRGSEMNPSFLLNRFNVAGGDQFSIDTCTSRPDQAEPQSALLSMSEFDSSLSDGHLLSAFMSSPSKSVVHSLQPNSFLGPTQTSSSKTSADTLSAMNRTLTHDETNMLTTAYYTSHRLDDTRDLQAAGTLKAADWILVPPVPEGTASYMRTGRVHEIKSRACTDRVFNSSHMDHELKQVLQNKLQACLFTSDESLREKVPRSLGAYTDVVPLEVVNPPRVSVTFRIPSVCFKAWSLRFNRPMLLRRVVLPSGHGNLSPESCSLAKLLSDVDHPVIVGFRDVFFTSAFGDNSAVVVYEYTPCSSTVQQTHMSDPMKLTSFSSPFNVSRTVRPHSSLKSGPSELGMLPESTVWSYLVQLTHGLRFIHQQLHRACGVLDPTKILVQEGTRLRINCFGMMEILFNAVQEANLAERQMVDLIQLGKLIIGAACGTSESLQPSQKATVFNLLQRSYRPELVSLLRNLVSGQMTLNELITITAPHAYDQLTNVVDHSDFLERQLFLNMECDRLFRILCKLQSIVERGDHGLNPDWSETGDRYMLKLFRDFLFHQSDHLAAPFLDLGHIISNLNKVEAGSTDRICLVSRDSQNVIIVTYADIKQWLESSFSQLVERHRQSRCDLQLAQRQQEHEHRQKLNEPSQVSNDPSSVT